jgi:hypothetical protein
MLWLLSASALVANVFMKKTVKQSYVIAITEGMHPDYWGLTVR